MSLPPRSVDALLLNTARPTATAPATDMAHLHRATATTVARHLFALEHLD